MEVPVIYHRDPRVKRLQHPSTAAFALYFGRRSLLAGKELTHVDEMGVMGCVQSASWVYEGR